jgi:hypothetical protein
MKPSTLIGLSILGFVVALLAPAYVRFPVEGVIPWSWIMGCIFWASVVGLLVGGWLSSGELRSYVVPYFVEEEEEYK